MEADPVIERLGVERAAELGAILEPLGLEIIDSAQRERLEQEAGGYRRLAALVEPFSSDEGGVAPGS